MDLQVKAYAILVTVIVLAAVAHMALEKIEKRDPEKAGRLLSSVLGGIILLAGVIKFFDPYVVQFAQLTSLGFAPFADLAKWAAPLTEITVGTMLLTSLFWKKYLSDKWAHYLFISVNVMLIAVMTVALSVHLQHGAPATLLPFDCKYPVLSIVVMAFTARNIRIQLELTQKSHHENVLSCA